MFLLFAFRLPAATTRTKCVGQLGDREDALAVEPLAIFLRYAGQQTEFVLFPRLRAAPSFELALAAMSVQHKIRRRIAGQECGISWIRFRTSPAKAGVFTFSVA